MLDPSMSDYKGINLPKEMIDHILRLIENPRTKKYGFKNPTEFVKDAVRALIMKIEKDLDRVPLNVFDKKSEDDEKKEDSKL